MSLLKDAKSTGIFFLVCLFLFLILAIPFHRADFVRLFSWKVSPHAEDAAIQGTVELFNQVYTDIHATDGMTSMLNEFPARKQLRHELYKNLGFLRVRNLILVLDMADMTVREIKRPFPDAAEATVFEEWNYIFQRTGTRETVVPIKGMGEGFTYFLVRTQKGWTVVDYEPAEIVMKEKKNEFYY